VPKKTVDQIDVQGKTVLVRVDFNVPLDDAGHITDDRRIVKALPTIQNILDRGGRAVLMSHLGRPTGDPEHDKGLSLAPIADRLGKLLDQPVKMVPDCIGPAVEQAVKNLQNGQCALLENLRFHPAETIKDKNATNDPALRAAKDGFAAALCAGADIYVNDAFGTCHRDNASMLTVPQQMAGKPKVSGFLVQKELRFLGDALADPKRPFIAILGGKKVSDKINVIQALIPKCDAILIGGAMNYTFQAAAGGKIGNSLVEPDKYDMARNLRAAAGDKLKLPVDVVTATELKNGVDTQVIEGDIPDGREGFDAGPKTVAGYSDIIKTAGTVVWNGPMGVFEIPPFDAGTMAIAHAMVAATEAGAVTIVGGGDSAAAVEQAGLADRMSHVSTGGGASLEFLEGKTFAAIEVLDDA
jgi:phosphoglycerate kinase